MGVRSIIHVIIGRLLRFGRSGGSVAKAQAGDVWLSFANIELEMDELAKERGVDLSFEIGDVTDRYVFADFIHCKLVFEKIIIHAIGHSKAGGRVRVRCEQEGKAKAGSANYRYTFESSGGGEPMTENELFSCRAYTDRLGGKIECGSVQGGGLVYTVTIPFRLHRKAEFTDPETGDIVEISAK